MNPIQSRDAELAWFSNFQLMRAELAAYEAQMGSALANGGELGEVSGKFGQLQADLKAIAAAIESTRARRPGVIIAEFKAQASELRGLAKAKRIERAEIIRKSEKLLKSLSEIEDVTYSREILCAARSGIWFSVHDCRYEAQDLTPAENQWDPGNRAPFLLPKSRQLLDEAFNLESRAQTLEASQVNTSGSCEAGSLDELISTLYSDPLCIGPHPQDVAAWASAKEHEFMTNRPGQSIGQRRFSLQWNNSRINTSLSFAEFEVVREVAA